jgi:uncharacterized protein YjbJ (UPF0337 family)
MLIVRFLIVRLTRRCRRGERGTFPPCRSFPRYTIGDIPIYNDRIKGSAQQAKGKVKEVTGKASGDKKLRAEGKADKVKGKVRNVIGSLKDAVRGR